MTEKLERCPIHSTGEPGYEWPCPMAYDDSPPEAESCPHFIAELGRRIDDYKINGHYFAMEKRLDGYWFQEYRNHLPYGEPKLRFADLEEE